MEEVLFDQARYRRRVQVTFDYDVVFSERVFSPDNPVLRDTVRAREPGRRHRLLVIIDDGVAAAWPHLREDIAAYCRTHAEQLELVCPAQVVPGGERAKHSPGLVNRLHADIHRHAIDRQAFVVAIGGGALLDAVGYAAATAHRGVRLIRMPTTVLGQNDSGVGVKNGINAFGNKNFLGTFAPPFAVINDRAFLETLTPRDKRAGMAEAVKVALIRDRAFFEQLERDQAALAAFEPRAMGAMIRRAAIIHMEHIAQAGDPFEQGSARPLDFGHWAAHKLESLTDHTVRHGEAVAIGIALDCHYSCGQGMLDEGALMRICGLLEGLGFSLYHPAMESLDDSGQPALLAGLDEFRQHLGGELTVTLLSEIGRGVEVHTIEHAGMLSALSFLRARREAA